MEASKEKTDEIKEKRNIKLLEPRHPPDIWDDLEQLVNSGATHHVVWLVLIGLTLVLLIFLVTGFLLATAVLMTTFYFFINEHHQQQQLLQAGDALLTGMEFS